MYDPSVEAYRDAELESFVLHLKALSIEGEELAEKVRAALQPNKAVLIENGMSEEEADQIINSKVEQYAV